MQFRQLKRREVLTLLLGSGAAWPITARAQQGAMPVVGFLNGQTADGFVHLTAAFHVGLGEGGFTEGRNVAIEYRWANGDGQRMRPLAEELIDLRVAVLVATGGAHLAAKAATASVPIVCSMGNDPVKQGLAESINRPGGNVTGMCPVTADLEAKRLEMLHEAVPKDAEIGVLVDPNYIDLAATTTDCLSRREFGRGHRQDCRRLSRWDARARLCRRPRLRDGLPLVRGPP